MLPKFSHILTYSDSQDLTINPAHLYGKFKSNLVVAGVSVNITNLAQLMVIPASPPKQDECQIDIGILNTDSDIISIHQDCKSPESVIQPVFRMILTQPHSECSMSVAYNTSESRHP